MERRITSYTGCLLGLAAGDGLGQGPERINGYLPVSAYTQMAAYGCNGLLLGLTRGQMSGTMAPPVRYIAQALEEWAARQRWREGVVRCWISRSDRMDYRRCPEPEVLDVLTDGMTGTMEDPVSTLSGAGALMVAVAVGLFFDPERLPRREIQRMGAEAAALTHGDPEAFLSGAALAHLISRIVWDGQTDGEKLVKETAAMLKKRFGREYRQARTVSDRLRAALEKAKTGAEMTAPAGTACDCLSGAVYGWLTCPADILTALEKAALRSSGEAAVLGALLGAAQGTQMLPEELLDGIECAQVLQELAEDMFRGCPMMKGSRIFDIEWDEKYNTAQL